MMLLDITEPTMHLQETRARPEVLMCEATETLAKPASTNVFSMFASMMLPRFPVEQICNYLLPFTAIDSDKAAEICARHLRK